MTFTTDEGVDAMPLPWVRLDGQFMQNPKILELLDMRDGHRAAFVWCCSLAYAGSQGTDGFIPAKALPFIHGRSADAQRLVDQRLWWPKEGGWLINDWAEFQQSNEETQRRRVSAQERSRKGNCIRWHQAGCDCWRTSPPEIP